MKLVFCNNFDWCGHDFSLLRTILRLDFRFGYSLTHAGTVSRCHHVFQMHAVNGSSVDSSSASVDLLSHTESTGSTHSSSFYNNRIFSRGKKVINYFMDAPSSRFYRFCGQDSALWLASRMNFVCFVWYTLPTLDESCMHVLVSIFFFFFSFTSFSLLFVLLFFSILFCAGFVLPTFPMLLVFHQFFVSRRFFVGPGFESLLIPCPRFLFHKDGGSDSGRHACSSTQEGMVVVLSLNLCKMTGFFPSKVAYGWINSL